VCKYLNPLVTLITMMIQFATAKAFTTRPIAESAFKSPIFTYRRRGHGDRWPVGGQFVAVVPTFETWFWLEKNVCKIRIIGQGPLKHNTKVCFTFELKHVFVSRLLFFSMALKKAQVNTKEFLHL
jgi:hypothetical protein